MKTLIAIAIALSFAAGCTDAVDDNPDTVESDLEVTVDDQDLAARDTLAARPDAPRVDVDLVSCFGNKPLWTLRWRQLSGAPATRYDVDVSRGGGAWQALYEGTDTSILYRGVDRRLDTARVRSCNEDGCGPFGSVTIYANCVDAPR